MKISIRIWKEIKRASSEKNLSMILGRIPCGFTEGISGEIPGRIFVGILEVVAGGIPGRSFMKFQKDI